VGQAKKAIRRTRIACWIPKATNTHSGCIKLIAFFSTATMVTWKRLNITLYVHCRSFFLSYFQHSRF